VRSDGVGCGETSFDNSSHGDFEKIARSPKPGGSSVGVSTRKEDPQLLLDRDVLNAPALHGIVDNWLVPAITEHLLRDLVSSETQCEEKE
jgi:hypothetical protein